MWWLKILTLVLSYELINYYIFHYGFLEEHKIKVTLSGSIDNTNLFLVQHHAAMTV